MAVRWQDKSKQQFLGAVSLAEAAALRGRLHAAMRSGGSSCSFELLFTTGESIDCLRSFPRRAEDTESFEQARSLLRFFNSDTWFSRSENVALVKVLADTPVADRALFYQGVTRCRRDAGVYATHRSLGHHVMIRACLTQLMFLNYMTIAQHRRWQAMPVAKAIRSETVDALENTDRISDMVLAALQVSLLEQAILSSASENG
jgi:hypothetical protein